MKPKIIVKAFLSSIVLSVFVSMFSIDSAYAANPQFNFMSNDMETLVVGNWTTSGGTMNWGDPISATAGQRVAFDMYYHNGVEGTTATNTKIKLIYPASASNPIVVTGYISADNAAQVSDTGTINLNSSQSLTFESMAKWYPNQQIGTATDLTVTRTGNSVEVNIGSIVGGWPTQGHVVFYADISTNGQGSGSPTVDAGSDVTINGGQSIGLSATASDPSGLPLTYSWTCTGGSLANATTPNPTYTAPQVTSNTVYVCTITVRNSNNGTATDTMNVNVLSTTPPGPNDPVVNAGASVTVNEGQSVSFLATATDPRGLNLTYTWSCTGGSLSNVTVLNPTYTAPQVNANTTFLCTFTARNTSGNVGIDSLNVTVIDTNGGGNGGSGGGGWGGPELNVTLTSTPNTGTSPLNGVSLTANVTSVGLPDDLITYSFDCENNGSWDLKVETKNPTYIATNLCNYFYDDTYSAKVKVEKSGYTAYAQTNIFVGQKYGGGYGISVDAGPSKDIGENRSTVLNGYALSQYGYSLTYNWTCNGGSLSNANSLTPTYYAPSVNSDITYTCILYVTDSRGYKNSDTVNIIVRNTGIGNISGLSVATTNPYNITTNSAALNGTLSNAGGQSYASVRFDWGRLSSYDHFTSWVENVTAGNSFSRNISGLEKGKAYHFRAEATNGLEITLGQDISFITKPDSTTGFSANYAGNNQVSLTWRKSASSCYTLITRKMGAYPDTSADGTIVYYGTGSSVLDKNLNNDQYYYYKAWAVGCDEGLVSYADSQSARAYVAQSAPAVTPPAQEVETGVSVEALVRDTTQNEIAWQNSITANPDDELEFKVIITPTGNQSLEDVVLKAGLSDKISSIKEIKVNNEAYNGGLTNDLKLGTVALGESLTITFKGKIGDNGNFSYGSNELASTFEISAKNNETVKKTVTVDVVRGTESQAGLISLLNVQAYAGILTVLFILLTLVVMYLLIERKKGMDTLAGKTPSAKVEKSKYFNIK